jgi:hypothetical protein
VCFVSGFACRDSVDPGGVVSGGGGGSDKKEQGYISHIASHAHGSLLTQLLISRLLDAVDVKRPNQIHAKIVDL